MLTVLGRGARNKKAGQMKMKALKQHIQQESYVFKFEFGGDGDGDDGGDGDGEDAGDGDDGGDDMMIPLMR